MGVDYHVAIHAADWPTPAALNRCLGELKYPVRLDAVQTALDRPLGETPGSAGLVVMFDDRRVELEAKVTRLGPGSPYALGLPSSLRFSQTGKLADGTSFSMQFYTLSPAAGPAAFVPRDLNTDLRKLGVQQPDYGDGDYVVTFSFRSDVAQYRAGWYLMAGLIQCAHGLGFELQQGAFGTNDFARNLAEQAADPNDWK